MGLTAGPVELGVEFVVAAVESVFIGDIVVTTVDGCVWVDPPEES